jgi:hypothetical protein
MHLLSATLKYNMTTNTKTSAPVRSGNRSVSRDGLIDATPENSGKSQLNILLDAEWSTSNTCYPKKPCLSWGKYWDWRLFACIGAGYSHRKEMEAQSKLFYKKLTYVPGQ